MSDRAPYVPGPASRAQVQKGDDKWTLILVRELRHSPEKVWQALIDPVDLREWAPFDVDRRMDQVGSTVKLTWVGNPKPIDTKVTKADAPKVLEYGDMRWELEPVIGGTRLTLWHNIDSRFVAWGAAGWHISFDVLERLLAGEPIGRIVGGDVMRFEGWQRLVAEYAKQFGAETPSWAPKPAHNRAWRWMMSQAVMRTIFRWIHIFFSIPILGYIYSPFDKIPSYAPATRFVFVPTRAISGLRMWKGHAVRRVFSRRSFQQGSASKV